MSAYIVSDETISVIARGFVDYGVEYWAEDYTPPIQAIFEKGELINGIGQSLLNQNYASVNARYSEDEKAPVFKRVNVEYTEGELFGCIRCYEYQACETYDYFEREIHASLQSLKDAMLKRFIKRQGQEIPWGIE